MTLKTATILPLIAACLVFTASGCAISRVIQVQVDGETYKVTEYTHPADPSEVYGYEVNMYGRRFECKTLDECGIAIRRLEVQQRQVWNEPPVLLERPKRPEVPLSPPPPSDDQPPVPYAPTGILGGD